jgi:uncharacterized protein (TIGR00369 family)
MNDTNEGRGVRPEDVVSYMKAIDQKTVLHTLGARIERFAASGTEVAIDVDERLHQHSGIVHGGIYALLAESAASVAAALAVDVSEHWVAGMSINCSHIRAVREGTLRATAELIHHGRSSLVYRVDVRNQDGALVSACRCTLAKRPMDAGTLSAIAAS